MSRINLGGYAIRQNGLWCFIIELPRWVLSDFNREKSEGARQLNVHSFGGPCDGGESAIHSMNIGLSQGIPQSASLITGARKYAPFELGQEYGLRLDPSSRWRIAGCIPYELSCDRKSSYVLEDRAGHIMLMTPTEAIEKLNVEPVFVREPEGESA